MVLALLFAASAPASECQKVSGAHILVRDLLAAAPVFQAFSPDEPLAYSPAPGKTRVVRRAEMEAWARKRGVIFAGSDVPAAVCLERLTSRLTAAQIYNALKDAVASPGVEVELVDFSRFQIPPARLEFPLSGLSRPSPARRDAPVLWLGRAEFDGGHHVAVWATVRLRARRKVPVAAAAIPARREIKPAEVRLEERYVFPYGPAQALAPDEIVGRALRHPLAAGAAITPDLLIQLPDVRRGETTRVLLQDGPIRISFDATAGAAGARGDAIPLVNPSSGQKFLGTVTERRQAVVHLPEKRS